MNVLVSGGSGYIGSFVVSELLKSGHKVDIIARQENDFTLNFKDKIEVYYGDITEPFNFSPNKEYNLFIHLAAANDIDSSDASYALNASTLGTRYVLDFCKKNNIKKFIYYSTFQVYGYVEGKMNEASPLLPGNDYGITHLFAEQYVQMYQRTASIDFLIIRPTNIYGAPMFKTTDRWTLVPSCFCKEAIEKGEINLMSSGLQTRDFVDVNDIAKITVSYCENFEKHKNSIVNVSSGNEYSIIEIANMVGEVYQELYNKTCKINVHSNLPKEKNIFTLVRNEVIKSNFKFVTHEKIKSEIKTIFNILNKN